MLSPMLWQLNNPDRFDMYSVGVLLLQAAMPALRTDSALINFRRKLEQCKYDLKEWRRQQVHDCLALCAILSFLGSNLQESVACTDLVF